MDRVRKEPGVAPRGGFGKQPSERKNRERLGLVYAWWIGMVWSKGALGYPDTWGNVKFFENLQKFSFLLLTFLPTLLQ